MKKLIVAIAFVLMVGFTVTSCKSEKKEGNDPEKEVVKEAEEEVIKDAVENEDENKMMAVAIYQCPMKCEGDKTYDSPGQCPTCKMDLKEVKSDGDAEEHEHEEGEESEG